MRQCGASARFAPVITWSFLAGRKSDRWVLHTVIVIAKIERLHLLMVEAESAGRAFLVAGSDRARGGYDASVNAIDGQVVEVRQETADNPEQQEALRADEFALVLAHLKDPSDAERTTAQLISKLGEPFGCSTQQVSIGASIGVALMPPGRTTHDELLNNADHALQQAKRGGSSDALAFSATFYQREAVTAA